ncbi:MAG: single-stranded-DNA-specific exonuclease RecJ [Candidatus Hydrogenedentota bacterium]
MYIPKRRWNVAEQDRAATQALAEALGVPPLAAHLLRVRGINDPEEGHRFLKPGIKHISNPLSLTDMDRAVARIRAARDRDEKVLIFGDYDVDGITAAAIAWRGLRRFGLHAVDCGMPARLTEGYGLSAGRVEAAHADGVTLIITVDNGIRAFDAADKARELGVDLIVTDHHAVDGPLPCAAAVVNPKRDGAEHPAYHLCGAGIAFKLCHALNGTMNDLDIAAVGTVADIVPLRGENRVIVGLGLRHMAKHQRTGLAALARVAGLDLRTLKAHHIGFQIGPRLNAAGRIGDGLPSLRLLLSESASEAARIADDLHKANEERRAIERGIYEDISTLLDKTFASAQRSIVLASTEWHAGVNGIVASRLVSRYHRPVVLISIEADGTARGSARGIPGFDMVGAFGACAAVLEQYGGHVAAAGCTIVPENIPAFTERFEEEARRQLGDEELLADLPIDAEAMFSEMDATLMNTVARLEPLGHMNPAPIFCTRHAEVVPRSHRILKEAHIKFAVRQNGRVFDAIGFGMADQWPAGTLPETIDLAYTPEFNTWNGETTIQLVVKDIVPARE